MTIKTNTYHIIMEVKLPDFLSLAEVGKLAKEGLDSPPFSFAGLTLVGKSEIDPMTIPEFRTLVDKQLENVKYLNVD